MKIIEDYLEVDVTSTTGLRWIKRCGAKSAGSEAFTSINSSGYYHGTFDNKHYLAHRVVAMLSGMDLSGATLVDHTDCDKTNNHPDNLRVVSASKNTANTKGPRSNNLLGVKGVRRSKSGRFEATISINKKYKHIGTFDTIEEASLAFAAAHKNHHGE
ncbi:MAG: HNH endonuclease [Bacteroidales bacterium]